MRDFRQQAQAMHGQMIERRRDFHRHPELSFQEVRTAGIVADTLAQLGLEVQTGVGKTGVVGLLEGEREGPVVLVRCDMDALPINEANDVEYRSQTPNVMHACGHDGHTTIGLAVAEMLAQHRQELAGTIKFVFQPAEEIGKGARAMIEDGVLTTPVPEISLGLHLWNELPVGQVAITPGAMMASCGNFDLVVKGRGGHGGLPNKAVDPVIALAHIVTALQTIVSRNVSPMETAVISVTQLHAGGLYNIIPEYAEARGTIRTFSQTVSDLVVERMRAIATHVAEAMGCTAEFDARWLTPPVINNAAVSERLEAGYKQVAPDVALLTDFVTMVSEDVSYFLNEAPGVYMMVGSADASRGLNYGHHHPRFDFDEQALVVGAWLLASAVAEYVLP